MASKVVKRRTRKAQVMAWAKWCRELAGTRKVKNVRLRWTQKAKKSHKPLHVTLNR